MKLAAKILKMTRRPEISKNRSRNKRNEKASKRRNPIVQSQIFWSRERLGPNLSIFVIREMWRKALIVDPNGTPLKQLLQVCQRNSIQVPLPLRCFSQRSKTNTRKASWQTALLVLIMTTWYNKMTKLIPDQCPKSSMKLARKMASANMLRRRARPASPTTFSIRLTLLIRWARSPIKANWSPWRARVRHSMMLRGEIPITSRLRRMLRPVPKKWKAKLANLWKTRFNHRKLLSISCNHNSWAMDSARNLEHALPELTIKSRKMTLRKSLWWRVLIRIRRSRDSTSIPTHLTWSSRIR